MSVDTLNIRRLKLKNEKFHEIERWKIAISDLHSAETFNLPIGLSSALQKIVVCGGWDVSWWANRLLLIEFFGRAFMEQVEPIVYQRRSPLESEPHDYLPVQILDPLADLIKKQASINGESHQSLLINALRSQIYGVSHYHQEDFQLGHVFSDDASVKIWLPESVHQVVKSLADHWGNSKSDVLRNFLLEHLIGRAEYMALVTQRVWNPTRRSSSAQDSAAAYYAAGIMFSRRQKLPYVPARRTTNISVFGKATVDIKLWCPSVMRLKLKRAADVEGLRVSDFARVAITRSMFGRMGHTLVLR